MNELENLREKIDAIDKEMIALFEKRMDTRLPSKYYESSDVLIF